MQLGMIGLGRMGANIARRLMRAGDEKLEAFTGHVEDSGEGRWTVQAAVEEGVPATVLTAALYTRFRSREANSFAEKTLSAMRKGFGGHGEAKLK